MATKIANDTAGHSERIMPRSLTMDTSSAPSQTDNLVVFLAFSVVKCYSYNFVVTGVKGRVKSTRFSPTDDTSLFWVRDLSKNF